MRNHPYSSRIRWSKEDQCYIAECPELQGCMTHGQTRVIAAAMIDEAIELWLESAAKHGDPIPEPDVIP